MNQILPYTTFIKSMEERGGDMSYMEYVFDSNGSLGTVSLINSNPLIRDVIGSRAITGIQFSREISGHEFTAYKSNVDIGCD